MASRKSKPIASATGLIIGLLVILAAALAFILFSEEEDYSYNGFSIEKTTCQGTDIACWSVEMNIRNLPYLVTFYNHPKDVEDIAVTPDALRTLLAMQRVENHTVFITVPEGAPGEIGIAGVSLARIFGERYGIMNLNVRGASAADVTCAHAGPRTLVISIEQQDIDAAYLQSANCIIIGATNSSQTVLVAEAYAYHVLGVLRTFEER